MYVLTNKQMREADAYTIQTLGTPSLLLMERAGLALADEAEKLAPSGKITCVCGNTREPIDNDYLYGERIRVYYQKAFFKCFERLLEK